MQNHKQAQSNLESHRHRIWPVLRHAQAIFYRVKRAVLLKLDLLFQKNKIISWAKNTPSYEQAWLVALVNGISPEKYTRIFLWGIFLSYFYLDLDLDLKA